LQDPEKAEEAALVTMRMMYSRPLPWAEGTDFDPHYSDADKIALQVALSSKGDRENYKILIAWMNSNVSGECITMSLDDAKSQWGNVSK